MKQELKEKLFDELMTQLNRMGSIQSPLQQLNELTRLGVFLEKVWFLGFEEGYTQRMDDLLKAAKVLVVDDSRIDEQIEAAVAAEDYELAAKLTAYKQNGDGK